MNVLRPILQNKDGEDSDSNTSINNQVDDTKQGTDSIFTHNSIPNGLIEGLGEERNKEIITLLENGDYDKLLSIINNETNTKLACKVIINSIYKFKTRTTLASVNGLIKTALSDIDSFGDAMKSLVLYVYETNLEGERFFRNPNNGETLFLDNNDDLISFKGKISREKVGKHFPGEPYRLGILYISELNEYTILTGKDKGKIYNGSYYARGQKNYRPISYREVI